MQFKPKMAPKVTKAEGFKIAKIGLFMYLCHFVPSQVDFTWDMLLVIFCQKNPKEFRIFSLISRSKIFQFLQFSIYLC